MNQKQVEGSIKVICIAKDDTDLEYLKVYDAILYEEYTDYNGKKSPIWHVSTMRGIILRWNYKVIPVEEWRNSQIDKIIE